MICPMCDGRGFELLMNRFGMRKEICENCGGSGEVMTENERRIYEECRNVSPFRDKPMTNEEHIHSLTTEEKAEWLSKTFNTHPCGYLLECNRCGLNNRCSEDAYPTSVEAWVEWLKQPHKE